MRPETVKLAILFLGMVKTANTACSDQQTFGYNCEYQCHCAGGQACGTDGSCSNGCASDWEGEYCQRGNVAAGRSSSTSQSSTNGSYSSSLALDGNTNQAFSSCSHTAKQGQSWWQVDLGREYVLFTVKIWNTDARECKTSQKGSEYRGTMSTTRKGFTCADWLDQSIHDHYHKPANSYNHCRNPDNEKEPWCYTTDKSERWDYCDVPRCPELKNFKIWMDNNLCHHYPGTVNFGASPEYRCDTPVVGRHLKIQLLDSATVLTLCEVVVQAFQYKACQTKRYGPNCNNRCQCANNVKCDDKTGACPSGLCNYRFTGPYCNIEIPTVSKNAPSTPTSISVKWMFNRPHDSAYDAGSVKYFDIRYSFTTTSSSGFRVSSPDFGLLTADLNHLQPSMIYSVRVRVEFSSSNLGTIVSPLGPNTNIQTKSCEGYVGMPVITVTSNTRVAGAWPNRVSLVIKAEVAQVPGMIVECHKQLNVSIKTTSEPSYVALTGTGQTYTIHKLTAFSDYNIKATIKSSDGIEKDNIQTIRTAEDVPSAPTIDEAGASPTSISVRITPPDPPYGIITHYSIEMWEAGSSGKEHSYGPTSLTHTFNKLKYNTTYNFKAKASTSAGFGAWSNSISITTDEKVGSGSGELNIIALAAGLAAGGLVILAVIIIPVVIIRRKRRGEKGEATDTLETQLHDISSPTDIPEFQHVEHVEIQHVEHVESEEPEAKYESIDAIIPVNEEEDHSNLSNRTIKISDLTPYVKSIRGERALEFQDEFDELPVDAVKSIKEAKKPQNIALNRYKNIATYDHSRVVLQPTGEEKSDYINASYIHGYDKQKAYIASQGPLPDSVTATWRMVWQERCGTIIMLTKLVEMGKNKCQQYWPSQGRKTYGPFTVQLAEEYKFTDYEKRILKVTLEGAVRTVKLFHFTAWPDHDVPKFACSLLNFRANVLKETEYGKDPILVHCSAGVGRTGTFIAIDYLIRQGKAEKKVNFYECVLKMREQRPNMVQNVGQYTHIHDAILEYFKIGITYIQSADFPQKYSDMTKLTPGKQPSLLQKQYLILSSFTDAISPSEKALANMSKNRKHDIVPDEKSGVVLSTPNDGWDDYVNAVYATGYGEQENYIITQMPFPETMKDIWRIVFDTGASTIVMMNVVDDTYQFSTVYWPEDTERMEYGPLVVEGLDVDTSNSDITVRDLRFSKMAGKGGKGGKSGRLVRHFQLQNWPDSQATPSSPESIVELLEMVERWQQKVENKKILVHCLDGASQSGVFCVAHSVIEKVKVDHEVDVAQYLRLLRTSRPQLVNTYEQYKFIHEVVLRYLQGFDIYANFQ